MDDDDAIGGTKFSAMGLDNRFKLTVLQNFLSRKKGRKTFRIEIMEQDLMAGIPHIVPDRVRDRVIEASRIWMPKYDEYVHSFPHIVRI
jgi:hypothetical protein